MRIGLKIFAFIFCTLILLACGQVESDAQITSIDGIPIENLTDAEKTKNKKTAKKFKKRYGNSLLSRELHLNCKGVKVQGGAVLCKTLPFTSVEIEGISTISNKFGIVVIGFDRDAPATETIKATSQNGKELNLTFNIAPREYAISRIDGLPPSQVSTFTDAQLVRIRASSARKKVGFASREQTLWFEDGFDYPLREFTKTSPFGAQRILNGEAKKPHYGVDIAAPVGTPIYAPADGVVSMADDDLYFEGAMVLIDHGQGLISMYLHMSAIDVKPGQEVKRGEKIGEVGSKGRSTGPHLCWRLKWRNRHLDPELLTKWPTEEHTHD